MAKIKRKVEMTLRINSMGLEEPYYRKSVL